MWRETCVDRRKPSVTATVFFSSPIRSVKYLIWVSVFVQSVFSSLICPSCVAAKVDISVLGKGIGNYWECTDGWEEIFGAFISLLAVIILSPATVSLYVQRKMYHWLPISSQNFSSGLPHLLNRLSVVGGHGNTKDETKHLIWPRLNRLVVILLEKSNLLIFGQRIARHIKAGGCGCWYCCGAAFRHGPVARSPCPGTLFPGEHRHSRQP